MVFPLSHRIQAGDMLVEIAGRPMVGVPLEEAIQILKDCKKSIRYMFVHEVM